MTFAALITLAIVVVLVGLIIYLVEQLPIAQPFKVVVRVIALLAIIVYIMRMLGVL